jgi:hypothetical protein
MASSSTTWLVLLALLLLSRKGAASTTAASSSTKPAAGGKGKGKGTATGPRPGAAGAGKTYFVKGQPYALNFDVEPGVADMTEPEMRVEVQTALVSMGFQVPDDYEKGTGDPFDVKATANEAFDLTLPYHLVPRMRVFLRSALSVAIPIHGDDDAGRRNLTMLQSVLAIKNLIGDEDEWWDDEDAPA